MQVADRQDIFAKRIRQFKEVIAKQKTEQLAVLNEKAAHEEQFEVDKILQEARGKDSDIFDKLEKNFLVTQKIFKSRKTNDSRMSKMKVRFDMVEKVQEQARDALLAQTLTPEYPALLKLLIKQGLIKLLEEKVELRCQQKDFDLVKRLAVECENEFAEESVITTKIEINDHQFLTAKDIGGVILTSFAGRIVCDNTLKARLDYALQLSLPEVRHALFEASDKLFAERKKIALAKKK